MEVPGTREKVELGTGMQTRKPNNIKKMQQQEYQ